MRPGTILLTGTDTGVGKTVLTALLVRYLRERGVNAVALKPVCSGGRDDARLLHTASGGEPTLDEVNPWHFRAPVAPSLAARRERKRVRLADVLAQVRRMQKRFDVLLVEGAGGLLSPLGEDFNSRDLIESLSATPVVVCPNRLGAVNQVLLTLEALSRDARDKARVVLVSAPRPDASGKTNAGLLAEHFDGKRIFRLPWLGGGFEASRGLKNLRIRGAVEKLASTFQIFL
ncbi:MAG TPA: dethiobiotin synthase [Verrucomicrobiae bacterium]|nr:dethiobiotin synthase [Verrucomicrobiae bacterium]